MVDLRSDTLTLPDRAMLETILTAKLGDDGRVGETGRGEDPTVNALEDLAAKLTGKEAALLFPTGTMGNSCGVLSWVKSGAKVLVHEQQHLLLTEKFLFDNAFCRIQPIKYKFTENNIPDLKNIEDLLISSQSKLICLENTHNFSGGYVIPVEEMKKIHLLAERYGAHIHMDGARLFHAAAALNVPVKEITQYTDTVMFCISKGLGAPVGSLLCGSKEQITKARNIRKILGGGMRQAGIIAACGIYALKHNVLRLKEDIENAKLTASIMRGKLKNLVLQEKVESNIVVLDLSKTNLTPSEFCNIAESKGLLIRPVLSHCVRLVFFKGNTSKDAELAAKIILDIDNDL